jgi:hypothetical protein
LGPLRRFGYTWKKSKENGRSEMKKLWVFCLALVLAVVFALPAAAYQVKIGARIKTEIMYSWRSGTSYNAPNRRQDGGASYQPDLTTFTIGTQDESYLRVDFTSNDKSTGARIELGLWNDGGVHGDAQVGLRHMYGWYKFGRCKLVIGHTENLFGKYRPYANLGWTLHRRPADLNTRIRTTFINHGAIKSGRFVQIILYYYLGPWTFQVALGQAPDATDGGRYGPGGIQSVFNTTLPRMDLVVMYKSRYFSVAPGLVVYLGEWEPIEGASLDDDRIWTWALNLPFHVSLGSFGFKGQLFVAQNYFTNNHDNQFVQAIYWGGNNDPSRIKVEDTFMMGACLGFYYKVGRATIWLSGGWQKNSNSSNDQNGTWRHGQVVKYGFSFAVPYKVNKHLTIAPEIAYYYEGWSPWRDVGNGNAVFADLGSLWLAGIMIQFKF